MKKPYKTDNLSKSPYRDDSVPYSHLFDDINLDSELSELQSDFVFIEKNRLISRLQHAKQKLVVAETGFGSGLNFLLTLQAYQKSQQASKTALPPLHFISVEKSPLSKEQLIKSLAAFPRLKFFASSLTSCYPELPVENSKTQFNSSFLNDQVQLTLLFGDATHRLSSLKCHKEGLVDAWYLNGFSLENNSEMLSHELVTQIGRLTKEQGTLTTFIATDFIKHQLRDIGFRLEKSNIPTNIHNNTPSKAQNKKSGELYEMYSGVMQNNPLTTKGYQLRPRINKPKHVSIIGGGIASACAAYALTKQGVKVTLYCKDSSLAQGGSSNAIGALYPLLHQQTDDISNFYQQAFWRAKALYTEVAQQGFSYPHQWCGLLEVSYKESLTNRQQVFEGLNNWPKDLIHGVNAEEASKLANISLPYGGLFMPNAGWVSPQDLVKQIFNAAQTTNLLKVFTDTHITSIQQVAALSYNSEPSPPNEHSSGELSNDELSWNLTSNQGEFNASVLVICAGADSIEIEQVKSLPLTATRGQVTSMKSNNQINKLSTVICHKGYLTPENNGIHCIGATFQKNDTNLIPDPKDDAYNLSVLDKCLPELSSAIKWQEEDISASKARLRCMSQDHLPLVGAVPNINAHIAAYPHLAKDKNWKYQNAAPCIDNLYVLLGLGARGLCSAPLAADILTAELCNTPYPMNDDMLFNLSPNRFIVRDVIKRKIDIKS